MWLELSRTTNLFLVALVLWVALLSFFLLRAVNHYRKLTKGTNKPNLDTLLDKLIEKQDLNTKQIQELSQSLVTFGEKSKKHIQKVALVRFNPFEDAGGDQSFAIALLDGDNNGVVISSLHSRSGTRVYAKNISAAKPQNREFTKEEKEAVDKAAQMQKITLRRQNKDNA